MLSCQFFAFFILIFIFYLMVFYCKPIINNKLQTNQMGQEQSQQKNGKKLDQSDLDIDIISQVLQSQPSNMAERTKQAIRISQQQRNKNKNTVGQNIQVSEQFCRLTKSTHKNNDKKEKNILEGVLRKQEPAVLFTQSTDRYCFLSQKKFRYNETQDPNSAAAGTLNFNLLSCYVIQENKNNSIEMFKIKVNGCDKQFVFAASNAAQNKKWFDCLTQVTQKSLGRQYNLTYISHYPRFWRKDYFSQKQFRESAETGDLILMRGSTQSAMMQRAITQQQFDHVALVLKNIKDQILLFQANGAVGVGIMPWHRFISKEFYKQQQIVVYRKLKIERTKQFYQQFQDFVQRNMGRKYKFSVKKYIMNRQSTQNQDKKSYFCSSLVAKLYKNLQLLDQKISSTQYMPHSFTEKGGLELRQNGKYGPVKLGKQHIIVFQKMFFQQSK